MLGSAFVSNQQSITSPEPESRFSFSPTQRLSGWYGTQNRLPPLSHHRLWPNATHQRGIFDMGTFRDRLRCLRMRSRQDEICELMKNNSDPEARYKRDLRLLAKLNARRDATNPDPDHPVKIEDKQVDPKTQGTTDEKPPASKPDTPLPKPAPEQEIKPPSPTEQPNAYTLTTTEAQTIIDWHRESQALYDTLKREKDNLQAQHKKLQEAHDNLAREVSSLNMDLTRAKFMCGWYERLKFTLEGKVADSQNEIDKIWAELEKAVERNTTYQEEVAKLKAEVDKHRLSGGDGFGDVFDKEREALYRIE
ncbi:uncharacterized protein PODANS_5_12160 [Podospora anserina S mat+]|uniref:Podospora anserina S mat+ genomic DNA chromosome 5, supercontig 7 n=1 Tax=Podospora anserina (strain S / ATCC MYA-4624 / DSM 980 / FGSC 10383) TaxID=515849 RepID=B2AFP1_PODAN|nr:uncharacterized protein PODANS_5_12160 [Podospora anserina S mat+]CAP62262.1 unnamed protein product [Podospora anserina S mat+]CDP29673.1 Putative protein of unknown function [Podospora anserina S mat+]